MDSSALTEVRFHELIKGGPQSARKQNLLPDSKPLLPGVVRAGRALIRAHPTLLHPRRTRKRLRAMVGRSLRCTEAERARFEKELQLRRRTSSVVGAGFAIAELDVHVGGGILAAGAVAFRLFLFLVPFVYVLFTLLGSVAKAVNQNADPAPCRCLLCHADNDQKTAVLCRLVRSARRMDPVQLANG